MEKDFCVRCGSDKIVTKDAKIVIELPNPGERTFIQSGSVCEDCGDTYFNNEQIKELSQKIKEVEA